MSSVDEIRKLTNEYYHRMDLGDYESAAALYGENGVMRGLAPDGEVLGVWRGKAETLKLWQGIVQLYEGIPSTKHCVFNHIVNVDESEGTATAKCYYAVFQATDEFRLQPIILGRWYDTLERKDGAWRFVRRDCYSDLPGDLSAHMKGEGTSLAEGRPD